MTSSYQKAVEVMALPSKNIFEMTSFNIIWKAKSDSQICQGIINALKIFILQLLSLKKVCGLSVSFYKVEITIVNKIRIEGGRKS